jgi:hypothetical protein
MTSTRRPLRALGLGVLAFFVTTLLALTASAQSNTSVPANWDGYSPVSWELSPDPDYETTYTVTGQDGFVPIVVTNCGPVNASGSSVQIGPIRPASALTCTITVRGQNGVPGNFQLGVYEVRVAPVTPPPSGSGPAIDEDPSGGGSTWGQDW